MKNPFTPLGVLLLVVAILVWLWIVHKMGMP
jgi:hypothetical protein